MVKLPPIINHCYLMVTEQCPLRCKYCYIQDRESASEFDFNLVDNIKNMFTCSNKPRLIFFGGEPLVKVNLIKQIVEKYKDDFQFQVVTNGMVNFEKFMDEVYEPYRDNFDVQVSWDGNGDTRNTFYKLETNGIVYTNILHQLQQNRILVGRCVLDDTSVHSFYETYSTFKTLNLTKTFGADFTIAHQKTFSKSYHIILGQQLQRILNDIKQSLYDERIYIPPTIMNWIYNVIKNTPVHSCDMGNYVVIRPNGDIYPCTILSQVSEEFKLGNITDKELDTEMITDIKYKTSCQKECEARSLCDGGCKYERIATYNQNWKCSICSHTCDIYLTIHKVIKDFLQEITSADYHILLDIMGKYNIWSSEYGNGKITDKQKRLL